MKIQREIGNKSGIACSLNGIGVILQAKGDHKGVLEKYEQSLKIQQEIGDKFGIAKSLNNIGTILSAKGDIKGELEKYEQSLKIEEEIGNKSGIAAVYRNLGMADANQKKYPLRLQYLCRAMALQNQMGADTSEFKKAILQVKKILRARRFTPLFQKARESLPEELKNFLVLEDFINKEAPAPSPSGGVGRNAPCPCGSGKKYKRCCGQKS